MRFQILYMQISDVLQHVITPTVIAPQELLDILFSIETTIPSSMSLPFNIPLDLMSYYKYLHCTSLVHKTGIIVVMSIPLLSEQSRFHLYNILNVPVPIKENLTVVYDIGHKQLALSEDKTQYSLLDESTYYQCSLPRVTFCSFNQPIKYVSSVLFNFSFSLLVNLDRSKCALNVVHSSLSYPQAYHLCMGRWVVTTLIDLAFTVLCYNEQKFTLKIEPPLKVITLPVGCSAHSLNVLLPPTHVQQDGFKVLQPPPIKLFNVTFWDHPIQIFLMQWSICLIKLRYSFLKTLI